MTTQISTIEITPEEWRRKISIEEDEWVIRQFYGLSLLYKSMDAEVSKLYHHIDNTETDCEDIYNNMIRALEDETLDIDCQIADIEDELDRRDIHLMMVEDDDGILT